MTMATYAHNIYSWLCKQAVMFLYRFLLLVDSQREYMQTR